MYYKSKDPWDINTQPNQFLDSFVQYKNLLNVKYNEYNNVINIYYTKPFTLNNKIYDMNRLYNNNIPTFKNTPFRFLKTVKFKCIKIEPRKNRASFILYEDSNGWFYHYYNISKLTPHLKSRKKAIEEYNEKTNSANKESFDNSQSISNAVISLKSKREDMDIISYYLEGGLFKISKYRDKVYIRYDKNNTSNNIPTVDVEKVTIFNIMVNRFDVIKAYCYEHYVDIMKYRDIYIRLKKNMKYYDGKKIQNDKKWQNKVKEIVSGFIKEGDSFITKRVSLGDNIYNGIMLIFNKDVNTITSTDIKRASKFMNMLNYRIALKGEWDNVTSEIAYLTIKGNISEFHKNFMIELKSKKWFGESMLSDEIKK